MKITDIDSFIGKKFLASFYCVKENDKGEFNHSLVYAGVTVNVKSKNPYNTNDVFTITNYEVNDNVIDVEVDVVKNVPFEEKKGLSVLFILGCKHPVTSKKDYSYFINEDDDGGLLSIQKFNLDENISSYVAFVEVSFSSRGKFNLTLFDDSGEYNSYLKWVVIRTWRNRKNVYKVKWYTEKERDESLEYNSLIYKTLFNLTGLLFRELSIEEDFSNFGTHLEEVKSDDFDFMATVTNSNNKELADKVIKVISECEDCLSILTDSKKAFTLHILKRQ